MRQVHRAGEKLFVDFSGQRPHLVDPSFTLKAAAWYGAEIACPPQYLPGKEQIFRNSVRDRQDFDDLKIKAKPKTRAELKAEATKPLAAE